MAEHGYRQGHPSGNQSKVTTMLETFINDNKLAYVVPLDSVELQFEIRKPNRKWRSMDIGNGDPLEYVIQVATSQKSPPCLKPLSMTTNWFTWYL
jgi:hypothetical protein